MPLAAHGVTHVGRRRSNEDTMLVDSALGLFIVADGMGGHNAGEVASAIAVRVIHEFVAERVGPTERTLVEGLCLANDEVLTAAADEPKYEGMGTTVVAAYVSGPRVVFGSVGDSRIYLLHGDGLTQLTTDDSWLSRVLAEDAMSPEDAQRHPMRHVLTKVIGLRDGMEPASGETAFAPGDVLMLCSDGLHGSLNDAQIGEVLASGRPVAAMAQQLVDEALAAGASDNVTVVVVQRS
jgi:protein phosphatase